MHEHDRSGISVSSENKALDQLQNVGREIGVIGDFLFHLFYASYLIFSPTPDIFLIPHIMSSFFSVGLTFIMNYPEVKLWPC